MSHPDIYCPETVTTNEFRNDETKGEFSPFLKEIFYLYGETIRVLAFGFSEIMSKVNTESTVVEDDDLDVER